MRNKIESAHKPPPEHSVRALTERGRTDPEFEDLHLAVELIYKELGAKAVTGMSYAGEPAGVRFFIPDVRSESMAMFSNRPA